MFLMGRRLTGSEAPNTRDSVASSLLQERAADVCYHTASVQSTGIFYREIKTNGKRENNTANLRHKNEMSVSCLHVEVVSVNLA